MLETEKIIENEKMLDTEILDLWLQSYSSLKCCMHLDSQNWFF